MGGCGGGWGLEGGGSATVMFDTYVFGHLRDYSQQRSHIAPKTAHTLLPEVLISYNGDGALLGAVCEHFHEHHVTPFGNGREEEQGGVVR